MKLIVTADSKSADANVDPRLGRAKYFALCDTEDGSIEFLDNAQNLNAASGAGVQAASNIARAGADVIITGNCGPKAFKALTEAGIKIVVGAEGRIKDVVERFKEGKFDYAEDASVEGHW